MKDLFEADRERAEQAGDVLSIAGLDRSVVLAALFNGANPVAAGFLDYDATPMTVEEATNELEHAYLEQAHYGEGKNYAKFDYIKGRPIKISFLGEDIWSVTSYDLRNGGGAAKAVIDSLRESEKPDPNNATIKARHLDGTGRQAQLVMETIGEDPTVTTITERGASRHLGLDDIADLLRPKVREAQEIVREAEENQ
jgi:hypothetical protein